MNRMTLITLAMMVVSLGLYAQAEAGGFSASYYGPGLSISFAGPWYGGYWGPAYYGATFYPHVFWDGHRFHHRHGGWHRGHDDRWEDRGRHRGGLRGHR